MKFETDDWMRPEKKNEKNNFSTFSPREFKWIVELDYWVMEHAGTQAIIGENEGGGPMPQGAQAPYTVLWHSAFVPGREGGDEVR